MITADEITAGYAGTLGEPIIVRRFTGAGANRPRFEAEVRGKAWGYADTELVGSIEQGDQRVLLLIADLIERGFALPVTSADKVVIMGREMAIISVGQRKALDGTPIVYDIQARG